MSREERAMLFALAKREKLTASDVIRQLVLHAHREAFGESKRKK